MTTATRPNLTDLYLEDETAWLDAMAELIGRRELDALDLLHLQEFLTDMARRDRREVTSRLVVLLAHLLKWEHQPDRRSRSWLTTIVEQQQQFADDAGRGVLRVHADDVLPVAYGKAVVRAATETGLPDTAFPATCPYSVVQLLALTPASLPVE